MRKVVGFNFPIISTELVKSLSSVCLCVFVCKNLMLVHSKVYACFHTNVATYSDDSWATYGTLHGRYWRFGKSRALCISYVFLYIITGWEEFNLTPQCQSQNCGFGTF